MDLELRARFERHGFAAVEDFVETGELKTVRAILDELLKSDKPWREGRKFNALGPDDAPDDQQLVQILDLRMFDRRLDQLKCRKDALEIARGLLGPRARFVTDHMLVKPPFNEQITPWHQDEAFRHPNYGHPELSVWVALQDVDELNGCLRFVSGSHLEPIRTHRHAGGDRDAHALEVVETSDLIATPCPLKVGSCSIHNARTIHGAGPNQSPAPRYAYVMIFDAPDPSATAAYFPWTGQERSEGSARRRRWEGSPVGRVKRVVRKVSVSNRGDYGRVVRRTLRGLFRPARRAPTTPDSEA